MDSMPIKTLRKYQEDLVAEVMSHLGDKKVVLAASPGAGKTIMSIEVINRFLAENPKSNVLVLTHGRRELRTQYTENLQDARLAEAQYAEITSQKDWNNPQVQIEVAIPHAFTQNYLKNIPKRKYGLLIVDEAHHFYLAFKKGKKSRAQRSDEEPELENMGCVAKILRKFKFPKQLLLTGTPSKFIHENGQNEPQPYHIITKSMGELLEEQVNTSSKYIENVKIELAHTPIKFDSIKDYNNAYNDDDYNDDYNDAGDVKVGREISEKEVIGGIHSLTEAILGHLKRMGGTYNENTVAEKITGMIDRSLQYAFGELGKTMICCRSIKQAEVVTKYLNKKGVNTVLSDSKSDPNGDLLRRFVTDPKIKVLVVVDRGILGFDYPKLCNIVDFSLTRNIDKIYQMMARVVRVGGSGNKKFFKVVNVETADYERNVLNAALSLTNKTFLEAFNGKNFRDMTVPLLKERQPAEGREEKKGEITVKVDRKRETYLGPYKMDDLYDIPCILKDTSHRDRNGNLQVYGHVRLGAIREQLFGVRDRNPEGNKKILLEMARQGQKKPSRYSKDPEEKRLGVALNSYTTESNNSFDRKFRDEIYAVRPDWVPRDQSAEAQEKKRIFLEMARQGQKKPSRYSKDPEERRLGVVLNNYTAELSGCFDRKFRDEIYAVRPDWVPRDRNPEGNKKILLEMARQGQKRPSQYSKDPEERRLGVALNNYTTESKDCFDKKFRDEIYAVRPDWVPRKK